MPEALGVDRPDRRSRRRRRTVLVAAVTAAALAVATGSVALTGRGTERYRTATVAISDVDQSVSASGTLTSLTRVDASFSTAGTVATVDVALGEEVVAGQTLATLDADELADAVTDAQDALTTAQETLAGDLEAQAAGETVDSIVSGASGSGAGGGAFVATAALVLNVATAVVSAVTGGSDTDALWAAVDAARSDVTSAQAALLEQYDVAETALAASSGSTASADATCAPFLAATYDGSGEDPASDLVALQQALIECQSALSASLTDQSTVTTAQQELLLRAAQLDAAVSALDSAITAARDAEAGDDSGDDEPAPEPSQDPSGQPSAEPSGQPSEQPSGQPGEDDGGAGPGDGSGSDVAGGGAQAGVDGGGVAPGEGAGTGTGTADEGAVGGASGTSPSGATSSGVTVTAQRILADQAAVDVAQADLAIAEAAAAAGTLTAPVSGTVAQVALAVDDVVTASSTTAVITILGEDGYVVTTTMDLADVRVLAVGQEASGTVGGHDGEISGVVSSIGLLDVSTTTTPQFTVVIAVSDPTSGLLEGASSDVTVAVASRSGVVAVPTSALRIASGATTVQVLEDGTAVEREVTVGAIGTEVTEITDGLSEGETVVLADLTEAIDSEEDSTSSGLSGLGDSQTTTGTGQGGFPGSGGGFPAGGPGGGPGQG